MCRAWKEEEREMNCIGINMAKQNISLAISHQSLCSVTCVYAALLLWSWKLLAERQSSTQTYTLPQKKKPKFSRYWVSIICQALPQYLFTHWRRVVPHDMNSWYLNASRDTGITLCGTECTFFLFCLALSNKCDSHTHYFRNASSSWWALFFMLCASFQDVKKQSLQSGMVSLRVLRTCVFYEQHYAVLHTFLA